MAQARGVVPVRGSFSVDVSANGKTGVLFDSRLLRVRRIGLGRCPVVFARYMEYRLATKIR
jgi:hypothetical protein